MLSVNFFSGIYEFGGDGVDKNYAEAVYWYRKSAEQGYTDGQYFLGRMYQNGYDVSQDDATAIYWYRKAAQQGHESAQKSLNTLGKTW